MDTLGFKAEKKRLRADLLKQRSALSKGLRKTYDAEICDMLIDLVEDRNPNVIHTYLPMAGEVNIEAFIDKMLVLNKKLIAPKTLPNRKLENRILKGLNRTESGVFGTRHPASSPDDPYLDQIDLVIVPALAFDVELNRLGYGGGYYDTFLEQYQSVYKVGVCYPFQLLDKIPAEDHDFKMDQIIYPK